MADKLTYKGGSKVVGSSGTMKLVLPKGGGDFHRVPRWWGLKGTVAYVEAAIFKVPLDNGEMVRLVLPNVKSHMTVEIRHDGSGTFTFPNEGGLERAAVVNADSLDIIHEYQFAKISGGSVLKRTISNLPEPPAPPTFSERVAAANFTYTVGVNNVGTAELPQNVYTLNGVDAPPIAASVGDTVAFDFTAVQVTHPFRLYTDSTKAVAYTNGVEIENGVMLWTVDETGTFSYQCSIHNNMGGDIIVS
jgi:plastocyanin